MMRRAQAAMEFLMTYGWAILIMLVVIAVLFFLGVFSPQTTVSKSCTLPAGFTCYEFDMDASGNIYLDIGQATGKTITVTGIGCAPSSPNATLNPNVQIPTGSHAIVTIGGTNCSGAVNSNFKGKLLIQYTVSGSSGTRSVTGDVSAPLIGNSSSWGGGAYSGGTFLYRRQATINTGVSSNLTDFPAYFILNTNSLISAGKMNNTCKDLRVLDSSMSTVLDYEIENNTCNTTSTVVWFRIPQTLGTNNYNAYAYYGNNSTADAQNKAGVWRNSYTGVWHLGDASDSVTSVLGTNSGAVFNSSGKIGGAHQFANTYISFPDTTDKFFSGNFTIGVWCNPGAYSVTYNTFSSKANRIQYMMRNSGGYKASLWMWTSAIAWSNNSVPTVQWTHISHTLNKTYNTTITYLNGAKDAEVNLTTNMASSASPLIIGEYSALEYFNGTIDELRISNVVRTADWIKAEYGQTYSVGSEVVN